MKSWKEGRSSRAVAYHLGVSYNTLRNWEATGKIVPERSAGGWRRYTEEQIAEARRALKGMERGEVAAALGVSAFAVERWAKELRIRSWRTPGGHSRYDAGDVEGAAKELAARQMGLVVEGRVRVSDGGGREVEVRVRAPGWGEAEVKELMGGLEEWLRGELGRRGEWVEIGGEEEGLRGCHLAGGLAPGRGVEIGGEEEGLRGGGVVIE